MESMSECMRAWMAETGKSVPDLTELLGYKSRTSLFRLMHSLSNYSSYEQLSERLAPFLNETWANRFHEALRVERLGGERYALFSMLNQQLFTGQPKSRRKMRKKNKDVLSLPPVCGGVLYLMGCPWKAAYLLIDTLLSRDRSIRVSHFMTEQELLSSPDLLSGLIAHITVLQYQAFLASDPSLPWNGAIYAGKEQAYLLLPDEAGFSWHPMDPGVGKTLCTLTEGLSPVPLYSYDDLKSGGDYICFTEKAFALEHSRSTVIIKPGLGMQMMPESVVESAFLDFLSQYTDPLTLSRESLILTFEKRVKNFYHRKQSTVMLLSLPAMEHFAQSGMMPDQFFAFRPFTHEERITILRTMQQFSQRKNVSLLFLPGRNWPFSIEAYDGRGALLYPSITQYNSRLGDYRELFLPGQAFYDLFSAFAQDQLDTASPVDTASTFQHLIRLAEAGNTEAGHDT